MVIGIIGIVVALIVFLWGAYKNVSVLYLAPIAGIIVAVTNGLDPTTAFTSFHIGAVEPSTADPSIYEVGGVAGMLIQIFPTVFLGGLLGKVMTDSGAADSIATTLIKKFVMPISNKEKQARVAVLIMLLIEVILTFGGVDGFVAVFATFPICMIIAEHVGIPRRYVPAMLCLSCGANSAPFVLSINNIVAMQVLHTSAGAAAIPGFISFIIIEVGVYLICSGMIVKAMRRNEKFDRGNVQIKEANIDAERPHFVVAVIPMLAVFVLFIIFQNASLALVVGILATVILMSKFFPKHQEAKSGVGAWVGKIIDSLNGGAMNGATALMTITAAAGFAAVVQHTEAFNAFVGMLFKLPFPPMITVTILIIVIVAFTSSPPAALGMGLGIVMGMAQGDLSTLGINPDALARVAAIAVSTFETLPVNGLIILTTGLAQVKIKDAYLPMFLQTVFMTLIGTIVCLILVMLFPGIV
ncbi:MAG: GntP family permease [Clostridiales bacterium]|nr:GntP family permease [Clostridiales bacterium]